MKLSIILLLASIVTLTHTAERSYQRAWLIPFKQQEITTLEDKRPARHQKKKFSKMERELRQGHTKNYTFEENDTEPLIIGQAVFRNLLEEEKVKAEAREKEAAQLAEWKKKASSQKSTLERLALQEASDAEPEKTERDIACERLCNIIFNLRDFEQAQQLINTLELKGEDINEEKSIFLELACSRREVSTDIVDFLLKNNALRKNLWFCERPGYELSCHLQSSLLTATSEEDRLRTNVDLHNAAESFIDLLFQKFGFVMESITLKPIEK